MDSETERKRALARAYHLLSIRARSGDEMYRTLRLAGFEESVVEDAMTQLRRQNLLDDRAFAADWVRSRLQSRPRGRRLIEHELREKGISSEDMSEATSNIDDEATAFQLAARRAALMQGLDRQTFIRRLSNYLLARGFPGETLSRAVNSVLPPPDDS